MNEDAEIKNAVLVISRHMSRNNSDKLDVEYRLDELVVKMSISMELSLDFN